MKNKRANLIIIAILIVLLLIGSIYIFKSHSSKMAALELAGVEAVVVSHDKSMFPQFIYNANAINSSSVIGEKEHEMSIHNIADIKETAEKSQNIVRGKITGLCYTFSDGIAYTVAEVHVSDSLKGSLMPEDIISLYYVGGFAEVQDYNEFYGISGGEQNKYYKFTVPGYPAPEIGQDRLFFLSASSEDFAVPEGGFCLTSGQSSVFSPSDDGESFTGNGETYSLDEIKKFIK